MKIAIIYKSFLGATEKYANWLKEEFSADMYRFGDIKNNKLAEYNLLIIMSGTYAGFMPLTKFLANKWEIIKDKNVFVISVGEAPADDPKNSIPSYNKIKEEIRNKIKYFKIKGSMRKGARSENIQKGNLNEIIEEIRKIEK
jgi:flavodoxin